MGSRLGTGRRGDGSDSWGTGGDAGIRRDHLHLAVPPIRRRRGCDRTSSEQRDRLRGRYNEWLRGRYNEWLSARHSGL